MFRVRIGKLYIERIETNEYLPETAFIEEIKLISDKNYSRNFSTYEEAKALIDILEINLNVECILEEETE